MDSISPLVALLLFGIYFVADGLYTAWIMAVTKNEPWKAAGYSGFLYVLLSIGVINYVDNHWYIIPVAIGGGCGTFTATKYTKR